jgi:hypothetical protein
MCTYCVTRGWILGLCWDKSLKSFPLWCCGLKQVFNVNIVYGNLKSDNSQDYAQKPQQNCSFMNSVSVQACLRQQCMMIHTSSWENTSQYNDMYSLVLICTVHTRTLLKWSSVHSHFYNHNFKIVKHMFGSSRESNLKNTCLFNFL